MKKKFSELNTVHIRVFAGYESMAVALHVTTSTHTNSPEGNRYNKLVLKLQCCRVQEQNSNWLPPRKIRQQTSTTKTPLKDLDHPSLLKLCTAASHPFHSQENKEDQLHFRAWHSSTKSQQSHLLQHLKLRTSLLFQSLSWLIPRLPSKTFRS
jgi:hypothetical protein